MNNQTVIHFAVLEVTRSVLELHGIAPCALEDAVADVTVRILEAVEGRQAPKTVRDWQRLAARTAARYAVDDCGLARTGGAVHVDPEDEALFDGDDHELRDSDHDHPEHAVLLALFGDPRSAYETRQQIVVLLDMLDHGEMPEQGREILTRLGDGAKLPAIAAALGLTPEDVTARLRAMRTLFFRRFVAVEEFSTGVLDDAQDGDGQPRAGRGGALRRARGPDRDHPGETTMHTLMFHSDVTRATTGYLCKHGTLREELYDALAEVQTRALEALEGRSPPKDVDGWQKLLITIARNYLVDRNKGARVAAKHVPATCEDPDAYPAPVPSGERRDPVDQRRQLQVLHGHVRAGRDAGDGEEILDAVADGVKVPAIGRELGLPAKEVRARLRVMRRKYFRRLAGMGMLALLIALFAVAGGPGAVAWWNGGKNGPRGNGPGGRGPERKGRRRQWRRR